MEPFDYKAAVKLMEKHGYKHTAENHAKNVLFFLKMFDNKKLHLHATVNLFTRLVDLDTVGNLDLGVVLSCDSIDIENVKFEAFEKKLFNYLYLCVYGKPFHSVEDNSEHGLYFKAETGGSKAVPTSKPGGEPVGGDEEGKGKPSTKPSLKERKAVLWEKVRQIGKEKKYGKEDCENFYHYWTEMNDGGKKMRFEMEKVFDVARRLVTWFSNEKKWQPAWKDKQEKETQKNNERPDIKKHKDLF